MSSLSGRRARRALQLQLLKQLRYLSFWALRTAAETVPTREHGQPADHGLGQNAVYGRAVPAVGSGTGGARVGPGGPASEGLFGSKRNAKLGPPRGIWVYPPGCGHWPILTFLASIILIRGRYWPTRWLRALRALGT